MNINTRVTPKPFLKWAGGKRQLIPQMTQYLPQKIEHYIEPFVGGGAVFFHLHPNKAILIDINPVLINVYNVIKNNVDDLIKSLKKHKNESEYFYSIRLKDREEEFEEWSDIEKASRTIYMNKCCYNGLYRVNSKGFFNVPFGKYKNPLFCDEPNLLAVSRILHDVEIIQDSFESCLHYATTNSFIYMDPPYVPISETSNFTSYTKENFGIEEQKKLKDVLDKLTERGSKVLLSNSYCNFILDLYSDYRIETVNAKRAINSDASKRGAIKEVLIMNY